MTATAFSKDNRNRNEIPKATTRMTTRTTTAKNTPYLSRTVNLINRHRKLNDKKMKITVQLLSIWRMLAIELASQIEQQPLLPDLRPQITPPKTFIVVIFDEKCKTRQELTKLETNTESSMTYFFGL